MRQFVLIIVIIVFLLSACQSQSLESPMEIKWQTPPSWWGDEDSGDNPDGSYAATIYFFDAESNNAFTAHRFSTSRELKEFETDQLDYYHDRIINDNRVFPDTAQEYIINICNKDATVYEWKSRPDTGKYDMYIIEIFFSMDKTLYNINLYSQILDEDENEQRVDQFWELIDSIECPSED